MTGVFVNYKDGKFEGLIHNNWFFVLASGGHYLENPEYDFVTPWIRQFMQFVGCTNPKFFFAKGTLYPNFDLANLPIEFESIKTDS